MKAYKYEAVDLKGNIVKGKYLVESESQLIYTISEKGLYLMNYKPCKTQLLGSFIYKVNYKDISLLCKQFSEVLKCGMSVPEGLNIITNNKIKPPLKNSLYVIKNDVEKGISIYDSIIKFQNIYPKFMIEMVAVGEESGNLEGVFRNLSKYYMRQYKIHKKIKSAAMYPITVLITAIIFSIFVITSIIPNFIMEISEPSSELPSSVKRLLNASNFISSVKFKIFVLCIILILFFIIYRGFHRKLLDNFKYKVPVIKEFFKEIYEIKFSNSLNLLISSGIPIVNSIEIIKNSTDDLYIQDKIMSIILNIKEGESLSKSLENSKLFHTMFISVIALGEETGSLEEMLSIISEIYEENLNESVDRISTFIEPLMIVIVAIIVTALIVNILMPIIDSMDSIGLILGF
ncbi:type II secretion system F family protein [Clostridium sp. JNZ J1-5]